MVSTEAAPQVGLDAPGLGTVLVSRTVWWRGGSCGSTEHARTTYGACCAAESSSPFTAASYVTHTGPLTWEQRACAAVLVHWPAALARESALPNPPADGPIHVAIDHRRTVRRVPGVVAPRMADFDDRTLRVRSPPRIGLEHSVIDVVATKPDVVSKFRVLADLVQTRATTAERIATVLADRHGVADRTLLTDLLGDLASGACSVPEREFLRLARLHGLPTEPGDGVLRQAPARIGGTRIYRDVDLVDYGVKVELDGLAFHDNATARDRDASRDLDTLVAEDAVTVRLTYGLVFRTGCATMAKLATLLQRRGWTGQPRRCPACADA